MSKFDDKIAEMKEERTRIKGELNVINESLRKIDEEIKPILKQKKQIDDLLKSKTDGKQPHLNKLKSLQERLENLDEAEHKLSARKNLASQLLERGYPVDIIYDASEKDLARIQGELDELAGSESKLKAQAEKLHGLIATINKDPQRRKDADFSKKIFNMRRNIVANSQQVEAVNNKKTIVTNNQQVEAVSNDDNSEDRVAVTAEDKKNSKLNPKNWRTN